MGDSKVEISTQFYFLFMYGAPADAIAASNLVEPLEFGGIEGGSEIFGFKAFVFYGKRTARREL